MRSRATCHPEEFAHARGLCARCYYQRKNSSPDGKARLAAQNRSPSHKAAVQRWNGSLEGRARRLLYGAKNSASVRGIEFNLELTDIVIPTHCPVLGMALDPSAFARADNMPSLDRIDNSMGYIPGNVWVISWKANRIKGEASLAELEQLVGALRNRIAA